jgi:hypothetical protein
MSVPLDVIAHVCELPAEMRPLLLVMQFATVSHAPHHTWPVEQQWPALQAPEHTVVQPPQWFLSMLSSTHAPLHSDVPPKHWRPHVPTPFFGEQNWPLGHAVPQPLQF